jgi:hypothetical protein
MRQTMPYRILVVLVNGVKEVTHNLVVK